MKKHLLYAIGLAVPAAILYLVSTANYVFPGLSAELTAAWMGLNPDAEAAYPLMAAFARLLGGGNLIAPVCGTVAAALLFVLTSAFFAWRIRGERVSGMHGRLAHIAATVATVVFILTPAVRSAATHLEPRMFDFAWALLTLAAALPFAVTKAPRWLLVPAMAFFAGLGLCDSALFVAMQPFFLAVVWGVASKRGGKPYLHALSFVLLELVVLWISMAAFELDGTEYLKGIAEELKLYYRLPGTLFVIIFSTLPFVVALFSSGRGFSEKPGVVQWSFHSALSFTTVLATATALSPTSLLEPYGVLPVAASAYVAFVAGYLVAYWWLNRRQVVALVAGGLLAFVLAVSSCWNLFTFDGSRGDFADRVADKILADLGKRSWFVSDGTLDDHLRIAAAKKGQKLNIVSLAKDLDEDYLKRLADVVRAEKLGGSKNDELCLSLSLGVLPFLQDWFAADPTIAKEVAVFGAPDILYSSGVTPVPEFLFFGADKSIEPDWSEWRAFDQILHAPKGWGSYHGRDVTDPVARLRFSLRRHLGFVANNRGVYLQDQGKDDDAWKMYELVLGNEHQLGIDRDNICTIFNEVGMVGAKHPSAVGKKRDLERLLKSAVDDTGRRYLLWRLGTYYGYIRDPQIFIKLGYGWARSGRPGDAMSQIRRAIDFVPKEKRAVLMNMMAALYANENEQRKSREIYEQILAKDANDHDALVGLMRLEMIQGDSKRALALLERAAAVSKGAAALKEQAMVAMMKGDLKRSKDLLRKATDMQPKDMQAWSLLGGLVIQQIDAAPDEKAKAALTDELEKQLLPQMEKAAPDANDYHLLTVKGFLLLRKGEDSRRSARDTFAMAAKSRPDSNVAQDLVLGLDISLDDKPGAEAHAREVLRRNRNAPLANYVMGSLALGRGEIKDAEAFLRKAANAPQPVALAVNDLAEVLRRTKRLDEAESYARQAVQLAPQLYVAWETLGSILMDGGKNLSEAESAIRKACELSKQKDGRESDIRMLVSLARVQMKNGDALHAKVTIRKVQARIKELSDFERREFEELRKSVR